MSELIRITEALRAKRAEKNSKMLLKLYFIASKTYNLFKLLEKYIFWTNYWGAKTYAGPLTFNIEGARPPCPMSNIGGIRPTNNLGVPPK